MYKLARGLQFVQQLDLHTRVASSLRKIHRFGDQATSDSNAARARFHMKQAQHRTGFVELLHQHRSHDRSFPLRDPRAVTGGIERSEELRTDVEQRLLLCRAEFKLFHHRRDGALCNVADVAGAMRAKDVRRRITRRNVGAEGALDAFHRVQHGPVHVGRQGAHQCSVARPGDRLQCRDFHPPCAGERKRLLAAVAAVGRPGHHANRLQTPNDSAQIPGIQPQRPAQRGHRPLIGEGQFAQHPHFSGGVGTAGRARLHGTEALPEEPGEAPERLDLLVERHLIHGASG